MINISIEYKQLKCGITAPCQVLFTYMNFYFVLQGFHLHIKFKHEVLFYFNKGYFIMSIVNITDICFSSIFCLTCS